VLDTKWLTLSGGIDALHAVYSMHIRVIGLRREYKQVVPQRVEGGKQLLKKSTSLVRMGMRMPRVGMLQMMQNMRKRWNTLPLMKRGTFLSLPWGTSKGWLGLQMQSDNLQMQNEAPEFAFAN
jgi:hypothetical protein